MTPEQKKRIEEIAGRWHRAEKCDNRQTAQAIFDIGYLTGIIFALEEEIAPYRRHLGDPK